MSLLKDLFSLEESDTEVKTDILAEDDEELEYGIEDGVEGDGIEDGEDISDIEDTATPKSNTVAPKILNQYGYNRTVKTESEYTDQLIEYFTRIQPQSLNALERGMMPKEKFIDEVKTYINTLGLNDDLKLKVFKNFSSFLWSYDILDELIDDPDISDIKVIAWNIIRDKRLGKRETSNVKFRSPKHFQRFVEHAAIKNKVSISDQNALQNFVDKKSNPNFILRFNISTRFVNSTEAPYLHIRKIPKTKYTVDKLVDLGMFNRKTADYLIKAAGNRDGILFTGKGASGKTTLMNTLIDYIPETYSGLVIQENEELFSNHPDMMFQHTVMNRGEGKITYDLKDLARNGLLVDLDYFIIGEIKGGEALYMLNAAYTGHRCWASVHGASATEAINKLVDYIKYASDYSREEAMQMLTHINTVVFMKDFHVQEIAEVVGWDDESKKLIYKNIPVD